MASFTVRVAHLGTGCMQPRANPMRGPMTPCARAQCGTRCAAPVPTPLTLGFSTKRCTWPYSSITTTPYLVGSSTCQQRRARCKFATCVKVWSIWYNLNEHSKQGLAAQAQCALPWSPGWWPQRRGPCGSRAYPSAGNRRSRRCAEHVYTHSGVSTAVPARGRSGFVTQVGSTAAEPTCCGFLYTSK